MLVFSDDALDPGDHLGDPGVHSGILSLGTADAPADDTNLFAGATVAVGTHEQGAAGVALKRQRV